MKAEVIQICLLFLSVCAHAQTGFFLVIKNNKDCVHSVKSVNRQEEYCIPDEPIIKETEFKIAGTMQYDVMKTKQYFNIRFTKGGFETFKLICNHMPEKQLLLLVNGFAAGIYENKNLTPVEVMPISGPANSKEIKWVYEHLKNHD